MLIRGKKDLIKYTEDWENLRFKSSDNSNESLKEDYGCFLFDIRRFNY